jgi:hypothetical protein
MTSNGKILVSAALSCFLACLLKSPCQVRSYDRNVVCESGYRLEELAKQYEDAVDFDEESDQRPAEKDEQDAGHECCRTLDLLTTGEEEEGSLDSEE